jgi:DNA-binding response OmpR family regulator
MSATKRTVLVVDDSEICREIVKLALQARGYEVVALDTPFGFAATLARMQPDLVLVDVNMPALHGGKLVEVALQKGLCTCPIVFHSDRPVRELQSLVLATGASGFIQKTNDPDELAARVEDCLNGTWPKRERAAEPSRHTTPPPSMRPVEIGPRSQRTSELAAIPQRTLDTPPLSQRNHDTAPPSQRTVTSPTGWVRGKF